MRKRVKISLLCVLLMVLGLSITANAGSYWIDGTHSGTYYEVNGLLKRSDVYPSGNYYKASILNVSSTNTLKITTKVYTNYYGKKTPELDYSVSGRKSISTDGNTQWPASYANYIYFINNSTIKDIRVYP